MKRLMNKAAAKVMDLGIRAKTVICNKKAENFIDSGFKVLIIVVLAALLLAGLYVLLGDVIMPTLTTRVKDLFNYKG